MALRASSQRREDADWATCTDLAKPVVTKGRAADGTCPPTTVSATTGVSDTSASTAPTASDSMTTKTSTDSTGVEGEPNSGAVSNGSNGNEDGNGEGGLSTLEIVGIVAGVVSAIVAVGGGFKFWPSRV